MSILLSKPLAKSYPAIFHPEADGGYFIEFPDFQGAYTRIDEENISHGIAMAEHALGMVLADFLEHNEPLPEPTPINKISVKEDSFATLIRVDVAIYLRDTELIKKTLTIPKWADKLGRQADINFSELLTESIVDKVNDIFVTKKSVQ